MNLRHLRALAAVADQGSIAAAARQLCITQPAVTRAVRDLEEEVGLPLVERNSWGISMTPQGRQLLARGRLIVREFELASEEMARLRGEGSARLRVGLTPLAGMRLLPLALMEFRRSMPEVAVEFLELNLLQVVDGIRCGHLDIALATVPIWTGSPFISCTELLVAPTVFVTRKKGLHAAATSLAELQHAEWIHADATESFPIFLAGEFAHQGLTPPPRITRCTSLMLTTSLLMNAEVVMPVSRFILETMDETNLESLLLPITPPEHRLNLLVREGSVLSHAADVLVQCISNSVGREIVPPSRIFPILQQSGWKVDRG